MSSKPVPELTSLKPLKEVTSLKPLKKVKSTKRVPGMVPAKQRLEKRPSKVDKSAKSSHKENYVQAQLKLKVTDPETADIKPEMASFVAESFGLPELPSHILSGKTSFEPELQQSTTAVNEEVILPTILNHLLSANDTISTSSQDSGGPTFALKSFQRESQILESTLGTDLRANQGPNQKFIPKALPGRKRLLIPQIFDMNHFARATSQLLENEENIQNRGKISLIWGVVLPEKLT